MLCFQGTGHKARCVSPPVGFFSLASIIRSIGGGIGLIWGPCASYLSLSLSVRSYSPSFWISTPTSRLFYVSGGEPESPSFHHGFAGCWRRGEGWREVVRLIITDRRFGGGDWGRGSDISGVGRRRADGRYLFLFFSGFILPHWRAAGHAVVGSMSLFFTFLFFSLFAFLHFWDRGGHGLIWTAASRILVLCFSGYPHCRRSLELFLVWRVLSGSWGLQPRSVGTGGSCLAALWEGVDGETDGWEGVCDVEVGWEVSRVVYVARLPPGRFFHRPLLSLSPAWIRLSGRGS